MTIDTKFFFKDGLWQSNQKAKEYVATAIHYADAGSEFEQRHPEIVNLSPETIPNFFPKLREEGYDLMLTYFTGKDQLSHNHTNSLAGHIAYQQHNENGELNWQVFHVYLHDPFRGLKVAHDMQKAILNHAKEQGIPKLRLGKGINPATRALNKRLSRNGYNVDLQTQWINLKP